MKKSFLAVVIMLFAVAGVRSQTISPLIVEGAVKPGEMAQGSFSLQNSGVIPLNVTLELKSFSVDRNGSPVFRSLDPSIHVKLSEMSGRVGPRASRDFSYKIKCDALPCNLSIYASVVVGHTDQGVAVRVLLPHTIYITDKNNPLHKADVAVTWTSPTEAIIENKSTAYDRVRVLKVKGSTDMAGFPLFPSSQRVIHFEAQPSEITVVFDRFKIESRP
jgi:hypothetical protein